MTTQRIHNLQPSPTMALDAQVKKLQAEGFSVVNLTLGEPDFSTPEPIRQAAIDAIEAGFTHYTPAAGIPELRSAIAQRLLPDWGLAYDPAEIIVGVGSKQLLALAFLTICEAGDEVLVPTPTWTTYLEQIKLADATPIIIPLKSPFKLTARDVEEHLTAKTKVLVLNSPGNPTGAMIDRDELQKIADLAVKHHFFIVSDEIYAKITYGPSHISIAALGDQIKEQTVITINGFSKAYAMTGWRVGYAAGPKDIIAGMSALAGQTTSGTSSISQKAAVAACQMDSTALQGMVAEFADRREYITTELASIPGMSVIKPEGAFYAFPNIEKLLNKKYPTSVAWVEGLLKEAKVAVVPGEAFCAPGYVRISFATSLTELNKGVTLIRQFVASQTTS